MSRYWPHLQLPASVIFHVDSNLRVLYVVRVIRDIINQLIMFFIPIYMFEQSSHLLSYFGIPNALFHPLQRTLLVMAGYYGIERLIFLLTAIPIGKLTKKIGFSRAFIFSYILRLCGIIGLVFLPEHPWIFLCVAVIEGIQSTLFWPGFFTLFCQNIEKKTMGSSMGLLQFFLQLVGAITPAIGGFLAYQYGFSTLFLLAAILQLVSLSLVGLITVDRQHDAVSWSEFGSWLKRSDFVKEATSFVGRYVNDSVVALWPLYMYLIVGGVDRVGYLLTVSLIMALMCIVAVGVYIDKVTGKQPFYVSGFSLALLWVVRSFSVLPWVLASVQTAERVLGSVHWLIYDVTLVKISKGGQAYSHFMYRELVMSITAVIFWLAASALFLVTTNWQMLFGAAGLGVLLTLLVAQRIK